MDEIEIKAKLDELANLRAAVDVIALQKQEVIDTVFTAEIKGILAAIDAEFDGKAEEATTKANALEAEIRAAVVSHGATVKGTFLRMQIRKGKPSYNAAGLNGYSIIHPEINVYRTGCDIVGLDGYLKTNPEIGAFRTEGETTAAIYKI